jgi:hypothetical protein
MDRLVQHDRRAHKPARSSTPAAMGTHTTRPAGGEVLTLDLLDIPVVVGGGFERLDWSFHVRDSHPSHH